MQKSVSKPITKRRMFKLQRKTIQVLFILLVTTIILFVGALYANAIVRKNAQTSINNVTGELETASHALAQKNEEIKQISEKLNKTEVQLSQAQNEVTTLQTEIAGLETDLAEIEAQMFDANQAYGVIMTTKDVEMIAKAVWGEARGLSEFEQSMVVWCILNRVDTYNSSISKIVTAKGQFHGYSSKHPVNDKILALVRDVLARWQMEKVCAGDVGRTLPKEYLWFRAKDGHNVFRNKFDGNYNLWNASQWNKVWNPYE